MHTPFEVKVYMGKSDMEVSVRLNPYEGSSGVMVDGNRETGAMMVERWDGEFTLWGGLEERDIIILPYDDQVADHLLSLIYDLVATLSHDYPTETLAAAKAVSLYIETCGGEDLWTKTYREL